MKSILENANEENYAVLAPDMFGEIDARAMLEAAEDMKSPLILQIAYPTTKDLQFTAMIARKLAEQACIPVAVQLDHGADMAQIAEAVRSGFNSVMIDGSCLPLEENIKLTKQTVDLVNPLGLSVEAEIGHVGQGEEYSSSCNQLTDPQEAERFIEETGIDACAVAIGTAHGAYSGTPHLDFGRLEAIKEATGMPLVLHGSSGTGRENIGKACRLGINKVNICSDILYAAYEDLLSAKLQGNGVYDLWPMMAESIKRFMMTQIEVVGSANKAWNAEPDGLPRGQVTMRER